MKLLIVLALVAVAVTHAAETYDSKYDSFNVDELLDNPRLFKSYVNCFNDEGPCTAEGTEIKGWIPESMENKCAKCTEAQKKLIAKAILGAKEKYHDIYESIMKKFNSDGRYDAALAEFLSKYSR